LSGSCRKQEEGQNKQPSRNIRELGVVHACDEDALECNQDHEAVAEYIVVEGAEKLGPKKRRKAPLA
jgi:hypothetical protein